VTVKLFNFRKDFYSSCNTDWCNYAGKNSLVHRNKLHFKIY